MRLGGFIHMYTNALAGHDTVVADYATLAAHSVLGARIRAGEGCHVGLNCTVREDVSLGEYSIVGMGAVVLGVALSRSGQTLSAGQALAFLVALLMGGIMVYCFWLMITSSPFWIIRVDEIVNLFEGVYTAGRWPVGIYPNWLRLSLTFLVPVAFAVTVPAEALTGRLTLPTLLGAFALTALLLSISRWIFKKGARN